MLPNTCPFFDEPTEEDLYVVFQQNSLTAHTAHARLYSLREVFGDRIISRDLWPHVPLI